ncbi:AsmA-like C-terminal region-containing protein [Usitatibacter palustris]|uniref:Uncharacterized protein n=1 Tax=Usitatibacter palustris TaxID=2732487 RepID=A0A6M4H807_9PROT|nr:AsmA-like C-terminal region-containing protein [Usitatibacter palustris]QJR15799.1 hypothetical protein DSM104440_02625 [Usitatibacter palustris]
MDRKTVFTKTAKGITQVNQKSASLSKDLMKVLKLIDGKSNFEQIMEKADLDKPVLEKALNTLIKDGFSRVFETRKEESDPFASEGDDFDFTAPGKLPASTQRVVASAAGDISELARQQDARDNQKKNMEQAQIAARAKAKAEAESRAKLEADARAKAEAEQRAMEQARKAKEASEKAKAQVEQQVREEALRNAAIAAHKEKLTAEQKAKEEAEGRRLGELRAKAEAEAKALAEARAKAEAEAAALAKARAEAEAAAKKQAVEAAGAEKELKARLKDEIEARIRSEMEALLRNEIAAEARAEMQTQIMAEAKLAARAELEERLQEERQQLQQAEMAARVVAEKQQRDRADMEAKRAADAEARARQESEARARAEAEADRLRRAADESRIKSEAEADRLRRAEARAREDAEAAGREREEAAKRLEVERRAKIEAEARAMVEAEESERREKELAARIDTERRAREEAEMRAKVESRARETIEEDTRAKVQAEIEGDMSKRAEIEGKAQAKAYMTAKAQAERDEDDRLRAEQARKAKEIADVLRTKVERDEDAPEASPVRRRPRRRGNFLKTAFWGLLIIVVVGVAALHVIPLRAYATKIEKGLGGWLHDDVQISSLKFSLIPSPHLKIEGMAVGKAFDAKSTHGRVYLDINALLGGDKLLISSIELEGVTLTEEAVRRILKWGDVEGKAAAAEVGSIKLKGVKMEVKPALDVFDATLTFNKEGALRSAFITGGGGKWTLGLKPIDKALEVDFYARFWELPAGAPIPVSEVKLKGSLTSKELVVPEFEADTMEGKVNGTLRVNWTNGVKLDSDLSLLKVRAEQLVSPLTKEISVTGKLDGNFSIAAEGPSLDTLFSNTRAQGKFKLAEGSISNVDLVAVMQSDAAGQRAGVTKFAEMTGEFGTAEHRTSFRSIALLGGVLRGNGNVDIDPKSGLSGRVSLEIRSNVAQDRGAFVVSGTVAKPSIRRGG